LKIDQVEPIAGHYLLNILLLSRIIQTPYISGKNFIVMTYRCHKTNMQATEEANKHQYNTYTSKRYQEHRIHDKLQNNWPSISGIPLRTPPSERAQPQQSTTITQI
jgi:hypothetical protein